MAGSIDLAILSNFWVLKSPTADHGAAVLHVVDLADHLPPLRLAVCCGCAGSRWVVDRLQRVAVGPGAEYFAQAKEHPGGRLDCRLYFMAFTPKQPRSLPGVVEDPVAVGGVAVPLAAPVRRGGPDAVVGVGGSPPAKWPPRRLRPFFRSRYWLEPETSRLRRVLARVGLLQPDDGDPLAQDLRDDLAASLLPGAVLAAVALSRLTLWMLKLPTRMSTPEAALAGGGPGSRVTSAVQARSGTQRVVSRERRRGAAERMSDIRIGRE